jgi:Ca-activated chloride channel family protein
MLRFVLLLAAMLAFGPRPAVAADSALPRAVVIVDGSGSMWGRIANDRDKLSVVRQVLPEKIAELQGRADLGLVSYGHRRRRDCRDVETLVPVGPIDPAAFEGAIRHLLPRGKTPITSSLQQATAALGPAQPGVKPHIVLVADGAETCNLDPCAYAKELLAQRPDIVIDVVGIGVDDKDESALQCISAPSGGGNHRVDDIEPLATAMTAIFDAVKTGGAVAPAVPRQPPGLHLSAALAEDAAPLEADVSWRIYRKGESSANAATPLQREAVAAPVLQLADGDYHVEARYGPLAAAADVSVKAAEAQSQKLSFNAGVVTGDARLGGDPAAGDEVILTLYDAARGEPGPDDILSHRRNRDAVFYLAPGRYSLKAHIGEAVMRQDFDLKAGERKTLPLQLPAGELALTAHLTGAAAPLDHAEYTIYRRGEGADGAYSVLLRTLDAAPRLVLPAGEYLVHVAEDAASASVAVSLAAGERKSLSLDLHAGILNLSALLGGTDPGQQGALAFAIEPVTPATSTTIRLAGNGTRTLEPALPAGSSRSRFVLPAGAYRVRTQFGNSNAVSETMVTLTPGEETRHVAEVSAGRLHPSLVIKPGDPPLPGVFWSVFDAAGQQVASASRASPLLVLRDGEYALAADYLGKTYRQQVTIKAGEDRQVEIKLE